MPTLHIDFESYSAAELPFVGLYNYANHPTTGIHCMGFAFDDDPVVVLHPKGRWWPSLPSAIISHVRAGGEVVAHNATFEFWMWNIVGRRYGWPELKLEQMRCTMAQCYAMALPGSLEKAAAALGIDQQKDMAGQRVMMQLAKPKADGTFWKPDDDPGKFDRLYDYCAQDVEVEREVDGRTMRLSSIERAVWLLDQKINARGVYVDLPSIKTAIELVDREKKRLDQEIQAASSGEVARCTETASIVGYARSRGVEITGVAKSDVTGALDTPGLPLDVRRVLELRKEAAKSSTAKLIAMRDRASSDSRVRGCFQYHGASTGRWAHRGIQPGNLPRPRHGTKQPHIEDMIANLHSRDYIDMNYGPVMDAMADCVRGMITASPGHELIAMDFSAVEARVLAWLAGEEGVLDIFRTHGKIYEHAASGIYRKPLEKVTKDERQIGKVAVLALGYGGGVGAFQSMARNYGVQVDDDRAEKIKSAWREAHPKIVQYWYDLERAAIQGTEFNALTAAGAPGRQVKFRRDGSFLWCKLPSGRVLCYPYPTIKHREMPWGDSKPALHFIAVNIGNKWEETHTYGGSLAENVTQAVARDLLADAMIRLEHNGFPVVLHVHDEAVVEVPADAPADTIRKAENIMAEQPWWAKELPLAAEGWRGVRYRK